MIKIAALIIKLVSLSLLSIAPSYGDTLSYNPVLNGTKSCFLVYDMQAQKLALNHEGKNCAERLAPASTFNIALSLMGYDAGILKDETLPEWPFINGYVDWSEAWKKSHNPSSWMHDSVLWYSQVLASHLGSSKVEEYVRAFNYGNQDMHGRPDIKDGFTHAWLNTSLFISAEEQLKFLTNLLNGTLKVSPHSYEMTKRILFIEDLPNAWKLYGKTGVVPFFHANGQLDNERPQIGWFIGWVQKDSKVYAFVLEMHDEQKFEEFISKRTKNAVKSLLQEMQILN